jgi:hypothetical protein
MLPLSKLLHQTILKTGFGLASFGAIQSGKHGQRCHKIKAKGGQHKNMLRKVLAFAVAAVLVIGLGCSSGSNPTVPAKSNQQSMQDFFNSFPLNSEVVAKFTYTDLDGNLLATGTLGRNDDGLYIIESRGAQQDIDLTPLGLVDALVTYDNPAGTIPSGPNAGLPFYYIGNTMNYSIHLFNYLWRQIGGYGYNAIVEAVQCSASWDGDGNIVIGDPLPGESTYVWTGILPVGYTLLQDSYYIPPGAPPGLDVTTVKVHAPVLFGMYDIIFFDGIAGVWDPPE